MRIVLAAAILLLAASPVFAQSIPKYGDDVIAAYRQIAAGERAKGMAALDALAAGEVFQSGIGGEADMKKACAYFEQASSDHPTGMHNLALCYERGIMGPADLSKAATLYENAADKGFGKSMCALGNLLMEGRGVTANPARAIQLCTQGAATGDIDAITDLGDYYLMGRGGPRDAVKARGLYERAAAQGQKNAAFTLGQIYWNGDGTAKDNIAAARWWRVAYDGGRLEAARLLGDEAFVRITIPGEPRRVDVSAMDEAIRWYENALVAQPSPDERRQISERLAMVRKLNTSLPQR